MKISGFKKGLLIFLTLWLVLTAGIWFVVWSYADAYEQAQPAAVVKAYVENTLKQQLAAEIEAYSAEAANDYQSAEAIAAQLTEQVVNQEWKYRKSKEYTSAAPVYKLYCGGTELCSAYLEAGEAKALDFGMAPWQVQPVSVGLEQMERTVTVIAPADCEVKLNGKLLKGETESLTYFPMFAEYEITIKQPVDLRVYKVAGMVIDDVTVKCAGHTVVAAEEADTWYVLPAADEKTMTEIETFAPKFVDAYLSFTSNAGSFGSVQWYLAPEGELIDRLRRSLDGMSWVHYTTGKVLETEISNITYYGNVATYDAAYDLKLKSGDMAGNMHVIMVRSSYGWRVSDIELF